MIDVLCPAYRHSKRARSVSEVSDLEPRFVLTTQGSGIPNHSFRCAAFVFGMTVFQNFFEEQLK